jgi:serine/threonine-protein kinase
LFDTELVRIPPGGDADDGVVAYTDGTPWPEARFRDPAVSPDGSIVLVRRLSHTGDIATVTGPTTSEPRPGTFGLRGYEVRNDGTIVAAKGNTVVTIAPDGTETLLAGTGDAGFSGDGGPATQATLNLVSDIAETPTGAILIADHGNGRVRRIGSDGIIRTVAGGGNQDPDGGGWAIDANLDRPSNIAYDGTQENVGDEFWVVESVSGDLSYVGLR